MVNAQISAIRKLLGPGEELQNVQNVFCIEWHQFTTNSKLEIDTLKRDLNIDENIFETCLKDATKENHSFMFLNLTGGKTRMFKRFDEYMIES